MTISSIVIIVSFILIAIKLIYTLKNAKFAKRSFIYCVLCLLAMLPPIIVFVINDGLLEYSYKNKELEFRVFNLIVLTVISYFCFFALYKLIKSIDNHFTLLPILGIILLSIFSTLAVRADEHLLYYFIIPIIILILIVIVIDRIIVFSKIKKEKK